MSFFFFGVLGILGGFGRGVRGKANGFCVV